MSRSRAVGTAFESAVMNTLRADPYRYDIERLRQSGKDDQGDLVVREGSALTIIEAKAEKSYDLAGWWKEASTERDNYAKARGLDPKTVLPLVVAKRRQQPINQSFVITTLDEMFR